MNIRPHHHSARTARSGHTAAMPVQAPRIRQVALLLLPLLALVLTCLLALPPRAGAVRIKDIASFGGMRDNQLVGYGLVVGLSGTGDGRTSTFTISSMANMLDKMGVSVDRDALRPKNVAAVMVTAKMPSSAQPGSRLDATISSIGDASSLLGGVLLLTPLKGIDGKVYGLAQGPLALGGFSAEGEAARAQKNITTVGRIPNGVSVERGIPFQFNSQDALSLHMNNADFSTTQQVVNRLNETIGGDFAYATDASTIRLRVPPEYQNNLVPLMASIENVQITPDSRARVVVDEKTGTVVVGRDVRISQVAIAHGALQIVVQEGMQVSQPGAFSPGQTVAAPATDIAAQEENRRLVLVEGATLQELTDGLNSIGATPRDLISILRALKAAGSLHAELEVI
ncbi:flagellar P-ring protein [Desulfovibrio psychrotolerans]|uniref:Flagellar P-ring protein n=2 Tax=Desulfovibrio psychrotolerans TaxID=415242 RepID=A0A7J0BVQ2_9BACT|nr:flagellar P-ring protein [Desulfovibrio psychrotolerans]